MTTFLYQKPYASRFFGLAESNRQMARVPRYKFMYFAEFELSADAINYVGAQFNNSLPTWQHGVSFKIYAIDKPSVDLSAVVLNQYNRKRNIYNKIEYHPFTIKMYDTVDDRVLQLWKYYFTYYFGDSRINKKTDINSPVTSWRLPNPEQWGLNPLKESPYFFDKVNLYAIFGKRYTQINYIKPKITKIDWQQYDSNSSDMAEVSMTLQYEAIEYKESQTITSSLNNKFGFDITGTLEPPNQPDTPEERKITSPRPASQSIVSSMLGSGGNNLTRPTTNITQLSGTSGSSMNLFSPNLQSALSTGQGQIISQTTQSLSSQVTQFSNSTNPSAVAGFAGNNYNYVPSSPGVLGQFGLFDFGSKGLNI